MKAALAGSVTEVTSGDKIEGTLTITESNPNLADLQELNTAVNGIIEIQDKTLALSGTAAALAEALAGTVREVTTGAAITGNMTLTSDPNATQLQTINNATTGMVVIPNAGITLSGTPAVLVEALT